LASKAKSGDHFSPDTSANAATPIHPDRRSAGEDSKVLVLAGVPDDEQKLFLLLMTRPLLHFTALLLCLIARAGAESDIIWLVQYDPASLPAAPAWAAHGKPDASVGEGSLHLADGSKEDSSFFHAAWKPEADTEVIVEVTVRVGETTGASSKPGSRSIWPWRDGAPVSVLVSDGKHQEGLVFYTDRVSTWTDRFVIMDAASEFHTYRLAIRGTDMSIAVDGDAKVRGQGRASNRDEAGLHGVADWRLAEWGGLGAYPTPQVLKFYTVPLGRIVAGKNTVKISNLDRKKGTCDLRSMELAIYR
jgi:hypothetical protein